MDAIGRFLESIFNFGERQGWVLFLGGGVIWIADRFLPLPNGGLPGLWKLAPILAALLGLVILVVHYVGALKSSRDSNRALQQEAAAEARALERARSEAVANLDILASDEQTLLVWLMKRGKQRFAGPLQLADGGSGLVMKRIVFPASQHAPDVWMVIDSVWDRRVEFQREYGDLVHPDAIYSWDGLIH